VATRDDLQIHRDRALALGATELPGSRAAHAP
jgi:hypothetical protein